MVGVGACCHRPVKLPETDNQEALSLFLYPSLSIYHNSLPCAQSDSYLSTAYFLDSLNPLSLFNLTFKFFICLLCFSLFIIHHLSSLCNFCHFHSIKHRFLLFIQSKLQFLHNFFSIVHMGKRKENLDEQNKYRRISQILDKLGTCIEIHPITDKELLFQNIMLIF